MSTSQTSPRLGTTLLLVQRAKRYASALSDIFIGQRFTVKLGDSRLRLGGSQRVAQWLLHQNRKGLSFATGQLFGCLNQLRININGRLHDPNVADLPMPAKRYIT